MNRQIPVEKAPNNLTTLVPDVIARQLERADGSVGPAAQNSFDKPLEARRVQAERGAVNLYEAWRAVHARRRYPVEHLVMMLLEIPALLLSSSLSQSLLHATDVDKLQLFVSVCADTVMAGGLF